MSDIYGQCDNCQGDIKTGDKVYTFDTMVAKVTSISSIDPISSECLKQYCEKCVTNGIVLDYAISSSN